MKTTILMATLLSGVVMTAAAAQGPGHQNRPDFATLDMDGDGGITLEEMQTHGQLRFEEADIDGDGALSVAEITAAAQARAARMLERLDADGDGLLQPSEMQARRGAGFARMFERIDADGDGAITESEFEAAKERFGERRGGKGHGPRDRG